MNIRMDMLTSGQWPDKNCYAIYESKQIGRNQTQDWYAARFPDLNFVAGGKKLPTENWSGGTSDQFLQQRKMQNKTTEVMRTFPYGTQQRCIHRRDRFFGLFFLHFCTVLTNVWKSDERWNTRELIRTDIIRALCYGIVSGAARLWWPRLGGK